MIRRKLTVSGRSMLVLILFAALVLAGGLFALWRASAIDVEETHYTELLEQPLDAPLDAALEARIESFCSDCHALPRAEHFSRDRWHHEVQKGYEFYAWSGRNDLDPPPLQQTLAFFRARADDHVVFPRSEEVTTKGPLPFHRQHFFRHWAGDALPEISNLHWSVIDPGEGPRLLACDMRYGQLAAIDLADMESSPRIVARLNNPCHVEICDLNRDQLTDLLVADLGSYLPTDHSGGRVMLLAGSKGGSVQEIVLSSGMGRVADARPGDFDGDGDLDVLVADFGWYRTGRTVLLRNNTEPGSALQMEAQTINDRPGTVQLVPHDFDADGRLDFAALVSQEYEQFEVYRNVGQGRFDRFSIWAGADLTFGANGLELVDLDQDGDLDALFTNGDVWDNTHASPLHGVQWLENRGRLEFAYHRLTSLLGASRARAGDIDLDGDQDIIAVAWLPPSVKPAEVAINPVSIVYLEQTAPGVYLRHVLERGSPHYATLELADFDGDGDLDFAVGSGPVVAESRDVDHYLTVWWNPASG